MRYSHNHKFLIFFYDSNLPKSEIFCVNCCYFDTFKIGNVFNPSELFASLLTRHTVWFATYLAHLPLYYRFIISQGTAQHLVSHQLY